MPWTNLVPHGTAPWQRRKSFAYVSFSSKLWLMGGVAETAPQTFQVKNDVWHSTDGIAWTQATASAAWNTRERMPCVVFNSAMWILGGAIVGGVSKEVWRSTDGVTWTLQATPPWSAREGAVACVHVGKIWLIGGRDGSGVRLNDIWYSADGATWSQAIPTTSVFGPRVHHSVIVLGGKMWILAGQGTGLSYKDVWSSPDGIAWTQVTPSAPWGGTHGNYFIAAFPYLNQLWVTGGNTLSDMVWISSDGSSWTHLSGGVLGGSFGGRWAHAGLEHINRAYVYGGNRSSTPSDNTTAWNDVWYYTGSSKTIAIRWGIRSAAGKTNKLLWKVARDVVGNTSKLRWNDLTIVGDTNKLRWHIGGIVGATRKFRWSLPHPVYALLKLRYKIDPLGVGRTTKIRWHVRQSVTRTNKVRWDVGPKCDTPIPFTVSGTSGTKVKTAGSTVTICEQ